MIAGSLDPTEVLDPEKPGRLPSRDTDPISGGDPGDSNGRFRLNPDPFSLLADHLELGRFELPVVLMLPVGDEPPHQLRADRAEFGAELILITQGRYRTRNPGYKPGASLNLCRSVSTRR